MWSQKWTLKRVQGDGCKMKTLQLLNYERDRWVAGDGNLAEIPSAIDGAPVAMTGSSGVDFDGMLRHAREVGGPALRKLTFHDRARMGSGRSSAQPGAWRRHRHAQLSEHLFDGLQSHLRQRR